MTERWKRNIGRLAQRKPLNNLVAWGVRLIVPKHRVGVALVSFNANEEVLLLRHVFHTHAWGLPGGWLGRDEAPGDALRRELREETGLSLSLGPPLCVSQEGSPPHIVMAYLGWLAAGQMKLNAEIIEARWFGLDELPQPLWPFTMRAIEAGLAQFKVTPRQDAAAAALTEVL